MIGITLLYNGFGLIEEITADGHAGQGDRGQDIVCAAVSVLIQTAARLLEAYEGAEVDGKAQKEGQLELKVLSINSPEDPWLKGISDFITLGLKDVEREYPHSLSITVKTV